MVSRLNELKFYGQFTYTLPENRVIVSADHEAVGGKYPTGTNIRFKVKSDYVVDGDVKNGEDVLTADGNGIYTVTVDDADITITATVKKAVEANKELSGSESYTAQNGDVLTGSTSGTVTIPDGASITLSDAEIGGGIVCEGSATITLVGTNSMSGATYTAGIQIDGSGTTLTIKGNGSLTANGGSQSAEIGLSRAWDPVNDVIGGDIVIESGTITANGGSQWGAGIGTGVIYGNGSAKTARIGNITMCAFGPTPRSKERITSTSDAGEQVAFVIRVNEAEDILLLDLGDDEITHDIDEDFDGEITAIDAETPVEIETPVE